MKRTNEPYIDRTNKINVHLFFRLNHVFHQYNCTRNKKAKKISLNIFITEQTLIELIYSLIYSKISLLICNENYLQL